TRFSRDWSSDVCSSDLRTTFTPGAPELVEECHRRGWLVALVSGGFEEVVAPLADALGITLFRANRLEIADGVLTGRTSGRVVDQIGRASSRARCEYVAA